MMTLRRYRIDESGNLVQRIEAGKPVTDAQGLPVWDYEETAIELQPGQLGVRVEEGVLPRELIIP